MFVILWQLQIIVICITNRRNFILSCVSFFYISLIRKGIKLFKSILCFCNIDGIFLFHFLFFYHFYLDVFFIHDSFNRVCIFHGSWLIFFKKSWDLVLIDVPLVISSFCRLSVIFFVCIVDCWWSEFVIHRSKFHFEKCLVF